VSRADDRDLRAVLYHSAAELITDWPAIFEGVRSDLVQPLPYVVYLPPRVEGGSEEDAEQLRVLSDTIGKFGVVILPPP